MYSNLWHERVGAKIRDLPHRSFIRCSRDSGIEYAVQRLHGLSKPLIALWNDEDADEVTIGDRLSEAVTAGLGSTLFGKGLPFSQGLRVLVDFQRMVGPVHVVVGWIGSNGPFLEEMVNSISHESTILIVCDERLNVPMPPGFDFVEEDFLRLEYAEAVLEAKGVVADQEVASLVGASAGKFARFKVNLLGLINSSRTSLSSADPWTWSDGASQDGLLDALISRGRWADSFELACAHLPDRLEEFLDEAGNFYFNKGAYEYLWTRLSSLAPDIKRREKVAFWLATTASSTNRRREQARMAAGLLGEVEAPELRAINAVTSPSENMLNETGRALEKLRSPATLRAHGFALTWSGNRSEPVTLFREAMKLAEREKAHHLVVACGVDIAELEVRQGRYRSGAEWAQWALDEYYRRGLNERLRHVSALATLGFARLLLGEYEISAELLGNLHVVNSQLGVPGYEAVVSTLGDLAFVNDDYEEALSHYESNHLKAPLEAHCYTALNVLCVLLALEDFSEARRLATTAYAISRSSTGYEKALGELLMGMALCRSEPKVAEQHLLASIDGLTCTTADVHVAQAAIWLAILRTQLGRRKDAVEALKLGADGIRELGSTGWKLLSAAHPIRFDVRKLWSQTEFEYEFSFLGGRLARSNCGDIDLSVRGAELLAILSIHASGLSGERLHAYLYGDKTYKSTLKANISRLRGIVPIASKPYRIDATFQADFISVLELISSGELQKALNLYRGPLIPESISPLIEEWRAHIDESLRLAVIESQDPDHLIQLGTMLDDDLEIWEIARNSMPLNDYRRPVVNARIRRIRASWAND